eukprot:1252577-Rhodomonas_salina.1
MKGTGLSQDAKPSSDLSPCRGTPIFFAARSLSVQRDTNILCCEKHKLTSHEFTVLCDMETFSSNACPLPHDIPVPHLSSLFRPFLLFPHSSSLTLHPFPLLPTCSAPTFSSQKTSLHNACIRCRTQPPPLHSPIPAPGVVFPAISSSLSFDAPRFSAA